MQYFPLFFDLRHKPVVVVGGGDVACRKIEPLLKSGALVTVVSPDVHPDIAKWAEASQLTWNADKYSIEALEGAIQVWATTDSNEVNHQVHRDAKSLGIMVNVVDDTPYCDFITPSMIDRSPIQLAISSGGASPVLIRNVRRNLEAVLPQNLALLAQYARDKRDWVKARFDSVDERRQFWERFFDMPQVGSASSFDELDRALELCASRSNSAEGSLVVVEWGDDIELLSLKATRLMQLAELVVHTPSIPNAYIDMSRRDADKRILDDDSHLLELIKKMKANGSQQGVTVVFAPTEMRVELEKTLQVGLQDDALTYVRYATV